MASSYTTKLQLNQWAAADKFLREEFNQDNQRIEAACVELYGQSDTLNGKIDTEAGALRQQILETTGALESRLDAETADIRRQLDPASYHIYQLMLQNYYDGKYTGYKKALVFDGFQDTSLVATVIPGAYVDTAQKQVRILTQGAQSIDTGFVQAAGWSGSADSDANFCAWLGYSGEGYSAEVALQPSGYGVLHSVTLRLSIRYSTTPITVTVALMDGGSQLAVSQSLTINTTSFQDYVFSFSNGVTLNGLHSYTLRITNVSQGHYLKALYNVKNGNIGYSAAFTATPYTTGSLQTPQVQVGTGYSRVLAWARHSGGLNIVLSAGSTSKSLVAEAGRSSQTLDGTACTETAYTLENAPVSADGKVSLTLSLSATGGSGILYDYGILFI